MVDGPAGCFLHEIQKMNSSLWNDTSRLYHYINTYIPNYTSPHSWFPQIPHHLHLRPCCKFNETHSNLGLKRKCPGILQTLSIHNNLICLYSLPQRTFWLKQSKTPVNSWISQIYNMRNPQSSLCKAVPALYRLGHLYKRKHMFTFLQRVHSLDVLLYWRMRKYNEHINNIYRQKCAYITYIYIQIFNYVHSGSQPIFNSYLFRKKHV